jgi:WD40 repeat protein
LENRTYIYNFEELRLIDAIETCPNSRGLVALNPDPENTVLASPDVQKGYVRLNVYEKNKSFKVPAHQAALSAICLNFAGTLLATASEKGTLIRIFSTETGQPLQELRRGKEKADVYSICFDKKSQRLACTSDRNTIHIFTVKLDVANNLKLSDEEEKIAGDGGVIAPDTNNQEEGNDQPQNKKSRFNLFKGFLPKYFDSEWSYAKFKMPSNDNSQRQTCAFNQEGTHLIVISSEGNYYLAEIQKNGGNCLIQETRKLM